MGVTGRKPLYRHVGVVLLRAAATPLTNGVDRWPDLTDSEACRVWLDKVWSVSEVVDAVRQASPSLADRVEAIRAGQIVGNKQIRSASLSIVRYLLRSVGRPTPFGLFAGVAPVVLGGGSEARWGGEHRAVARVDTGWLAEIVARAEGCPELLERLHVVVNDLAVRRGSRLEVPQGPNRVSIRYTPAVAAVWDAAVTPVRFAALVDTLAEDFTADRSTVQATLTDLVRQGYLLTNLRVPLTVTDPFTYLMDRLHDAQAGSITATAALMRNLDAVQADLRRHNQEAMTWAEQSQVCETITRRMRALSVAGRTTLALDLLLDCDVRLPRHVAHEMERAASALLHLTRQPTGDAAWRTYHSAFVDRYGTGTVVPLAQVLDPDAGLGYPAGYPGSVLPALTPAMSERDERLLALAWQALADGTREVVLTDEQVSELTAETFDEHAIPPHVELSARVHAASTEALDRGKFTLTVAPARCAGTLTSRFTPLAAGAGLAQAYRALPAATDGALRAQMSFGPLYPHAENVCRVPAYLDHVLPLGEHRDPGDQTLLTTDDLGITATRDRLHLVSVSRRRVVEPQVFHALALDKQPPPLARFLAHLPWAFSAAWYQFDWGPYVRLPWLPRVRYRRAILSPAQWRLTTDDLLPDQAGADQWRPVLDRWRHRWACPDEVELRDADRTLRLSLDEPAHATILQAVLGTEPSCWWLRYRSPHQTDHLRLRIRTSRHDNAACTNAVGEWAQRLRQAGVVRSLVIGTYYPEIGRYGPGAAMAAAEDVFVADSHLVATALRDLSATAVHPTALAVANMVGIVTGFVGNLAGAMDWLATRPISTTPATDRAVTVQGIRLATETGALSEIPGWGAAIALAWQTRADALAVYRKHLPPDANIDVVLESLLHLHHNRAIGIDPDSEHTCRRLARQAALSWRTRRKGGEGG